MNKRAIRLAFVLTDFAGAFLSWLAFYALRHHLLGAKQYLYFDLVRSALVVATFWVLLYAFFGFYNDVLRKSRAREWFVLLRMCGVGMLLLIGAVLAEAVFISNEDPSVYRNSYKYLLQYFLLHFGIASAMKLGIMTYSKHLVQTGKIYWNTVVVGSGAAAAEVVTDLMRGPLNLGYKFLGYVSAEENGHPHPIAQHLAHLGNYHHLDELASEHRLEQAVIAIEASEHKRIEEILNNLEGTGVRISILPDIYQILLGSVKVNHVFGSPLIEIKQDLMPVWQQVLKRAMDITVSMTVLFLFSPLYLFVAVMVRLSSPGPIFFRQERIGKGGKPFLIIKYRSMYIDAERMGPALSSANDPRITPWGRIMRKTRLDEIPQFWNVLVGEMSLVGPRPERQFFIDQIVKVAPHYKHLNRVRPGITSLGQVKYGYAENVEQMVRRLKYDILYIENMSLAMDFRILLYTVLTVLGGRGK